MDLFEKFNNKFGKWYEGFFAGSGGELRPRDVLRKITSAMEDNRKEGLDGRVYVPNKYILELAMDDTDERDYLLSFLDEEELVGVLNRFMGQNSYHIRGPLDFTIEEVPAAARNAQTEKLRIKVRFEKGVLPAPPPPAPTPTPALQAEDDLPTVAGLDDDLPTVAAVALAALTVTAPDGRKRNVSLTGATIAIGRSRSSGNDLVLEGDGLVSKRHARIERETDGSYTLYDLGSMNGVLVGGARIAGNRVLEDGDEIMIGSTRLQFHLAGRADAPARFAGTPAADGPYRRAALFDPTGVPHVLASETLIGRAVTSDIVLDDPSVATRHARIIAPDRATYYLEDLGSDRGTRVNGRRILPGDRTLLSSGDQIVVGVVLLRFEAP